MALIKMTYHLAMAAGWDAGNRHMRTNGRASWNQDDWNVACEEFNRLWPDFTIPKLEAQDESPAGN